MDIEKMKNTFKEYVNSFNMKDIGIILKYNHSLRVMEISKNIAIYLGLSSQDVDLAMVIGILHDYARFYQWTKYGTFSDINSIDHGDLAIKLLFEERDIEKYHVNKEYYDTISNVIKYHNKYCYPEDLSERDKLFCKIIRDADKLDIINLLITDKYLIKEDDKQITKDVKNDFYNNISINWIKTKNKNDLVILDLALIFDINFKYSFEYIKKNAMIEKLYINVQNKDFFKEYFEYVINYVDRKVNMV